jgi:hypothetical protein
MSYCTPQRVFMHCELTLLMMRDRCNEIAFAAASLAKHTSKA